MWATTDEYQAALEQIAPFATYDFRVRDEFDNGEFITSATVDLYERGKLVHTEEFVVSSEFGCGEEFSAYGNGRDNHATTQALSYANAWVESQEYTLEERLGPYGLEWQREQAERAEYGVAA